MYEIIKQLCQQHGTTITALCEKITGSKGNLATWKKGNIRTDYLKKISEYFKVSTDYLLGNEEKNNPVPQMNSEEQKLFNDIKSLTPAQQQALRVMIDSYKNK